MKMPLVPAALRHALLPLVLAVLLPASLSHAAANFTIPQFMTYQGSLTDVNGNPLGATNTGPKNYDVVFRIWDLQSGGNISSSDEIDAEEQTVTVDNGYFSVLLGQGNKFANEPFTTNLASMFTNSTAANRYIEFTVRGIGSGNTDVTISPRLQLLPAPYAFLAGSANNAAYASQAGTLVNANNSASVFVGANGDVGIGTASPSYPLDINGRFESIGTVNNTAGLWLDDSALGERGFIGADGAGSIGLYGSPGAGWGLNMNITNGDVGIGTATPDRKLSVIGSADFRNDIQINDLGDAGNPALNILNYDGYEFDAGVASGSGEFSTAAGYGDVVLRSLYSNLILQSGSGAPGLVIYANNNVGIGTATPASKLDVEDTTYPTATINSSSTVGSWLSLGNTSTGGGAWRFISSGSGNGEGAGKLLCNVAGYGDVMVMQNNGFVGIGTYTPAYPLDVERYLNTSINAYEAYGSAGQVHIAGNSGTYAFSIYASGRIVSGSEVDVTSDARIKEVVGRTDTVRDLATVRKLQITDYRKIDKVQYGGRLEKGVLAQEVEKIIPEAVATSTNFIPDIYATPTSFGCTNGTLWVTLNKPHGLVVGDKVRLIDEDATLTAEVSAVNSPREFTVGKMDKAPQHLFVFGKQVDDFRVVNYDRLFTTGLGAIQELAKRMDQVEAREARVAELEKKAARVDALENELADLKKLVAQLAEAGKGSKLMSSAGTGAPTHQTVTTASLDR